MTEILYAIIFNDNWPNYVMYNDYNKGNNAGYFKTMNIFQKSNTILHVYIILKIS